MTALPTRPTSAMNTSRALLTSLIPIGFIVVAMLVSMTQAPWGVRIVAAVLLVALPGAAITALLFGEQADPALRLPMIAVFGLMLWLAVALVLNLIGTSISATSLAIGVGVVGLPATIERQRRRIRDRRRATLDTGADESAPVPFRHRIKSVGAVAVSIAAVSVAIVAAVAIQPQHDERYASLGFVDTPQFVDGKAADAAPGGQVRLNWVMRGYGYDLSTSSASVSVTIDDKPVDDVAIDAGRSTEPDEPGATSTVSGAVTFAAPRKPGKHVVAITVVPATADGNAVPAPGFISTALEVK